mmetsp:Transcript_107930/g.322765  ORF Transcript_107930/g.322765 Transcript_107930/m.322765 type:complete len:331 (-) Transcript_107930:226-1218(-)
MRMPAPAQAKHSDEDVCGEVPGSDNLHRGFYEVLELAHCELQAPARTALDELPDAPPQHLRDATLPQQRLAELRLQGVGKVEGAGTHGHPPTRLVQEHVAARGVHGRDHAVEHFGHSLRRLLCHGRVPSVNVVGEQPHLRRLEYVPQLQHGAPPARHDEAVGAPVAGHVGLWILARIDVCLLCPLHEPVQCVEGDALDAQGLHLDLVGQLLEGIRTDLHDLASLLEGDNTCSVQRTELTNAVPSHGLALLSVLGTALLQDLVCDAVGHVDHRLVHTSRLHLLCRPVLHEALDIKAEYLLGLGKHRLHIRLLPHFLQHPHIVGLLTRKEKR